MPNEYINTIRIKTDQLEASLESGTVYSQAKALTTAYDICRAAILSLPDIVEVHQDFYKNLKDLRPIKVLEAEVPEPPKNYLCEVSEY